MNNPQEAESPALEIPPAPPAPTCTSCGLRHLPDRECVDLSNAWWQTGPWQEPPKREGRPVSDVFDPKTMMPTFNPGCAGKHDRCCFDLENCDACIAYTRELYEARARAKNAVDVVPKK